MDWFLLFCAVMSIFAMAYSVAVSGPDPGGAAISAGFFGCCAGVLIGVKVSDKAVG